MKSQSPSGAPNSGSGRKPATSFPVSWQRYLTLLQANANTHGYSCLSVFSKDTNYTPSSEPSSFFFFFSPLTHRFVEIIPQGLSRNAFLSLFNFLQTESSSTHSTSWGAPQ